MKKIKTLKEFDLKEKRVLVRVDFNVPLNEKGDVLDDFRIQKTIPTIKYLQKKKAKTILISHLGGEPTKTPKYSLKKTALKLQELIGQKINFLKDCVGLRIERKINRMKRGEIVLLENLRFHKEEKQGDPSFGKALSRLGDFFLNDALSVCHRFHASVVEVPKYLPSGAGLLLEEEINVLSKILKKPKRPFLVILGGTKVASKIKTVPSFLKKADLLLLGTILSEALLKAKGISLRGVLPSARIVEIAKEIELTNPKLHLPIDVVASLNTTEDYLRQAPLGELRKEERILDIGEETRNIFAEMIKTARTIVWAGPLGYIEQDQFAEGTRFIADAISRNSQAFRVVGGGETNFALKKFGLREKFDFVSTGGGALLEFLSGQKLPGLEALKKYDHS